MITRDWKYQPGKVYLWVYQNLITFLQFNINTCLTLDLDRADFESRMVAQEKQLQFENWILMWMVVTYKQENLWCVKMIYVLMKEGIAKQNEVWDFFFFLQITRVIWLVCFSSRHNHVSDTVEK